MQSLLSPVDYSSKQSRKDLSQLNAARLVDFNPRVVTKISESGN